MPTLKYQIVTPERVVAEGEASFVSVMTESGEITVLPNHIPLATLLRAGEMRIGTAQGEKTFAVSTGLLEVRPGGDVHILADTAEREDELDLAAIEEAKRAAAEALQSARNRNDVSFADAAAHLERELARYKVAIKKKHGGTRTPGTEV